MKKRTMIGAVTIMIVCLFIASIVFSEEKKKAAVDYLKGYRNWTHVKSMEIQQGHPLYDAFGGIHHIYANQKTLKAMKSGKPYPDGSVPVFDLLEAKSEKNALVEGPRKVVGGDAEGFKEIC